MTRRVSEIWGKNDRSGVQVRTNEVMTLHHRIIDSGMLLSPPDQYWPGDYRGG